MPDDLIEQVNELVAADRRDEAVKLFFAKAMGIPNFAVTLMRWLMPGWSKMAGMAHTMPYDLAIMAGTQMGKPLPARRWVAATEPILVAIDSESEQSFHSGAKALTEMLPNVRYRSLEGRNHAAVVIAPKALADAVEQFFLDRK